METLYKGKHNVIIVLTTLRLRQGIGCEDESEVLQVRPADLGCLSGVSCYVVVYVVMVVCGRVYVRLVVQL